MEETGEKEIELKLILEDGFAPQRLPQCVVVDMIAKSRRDEQLADDAILHLAAYTLDPGVLVANQEKGEEGSWSVRKGEVLL